jgi:hypothetical protein
MSYGARIDADAKISAWAERVTGPSLAEDQVWFSSSRVEADGTVSFESRIESIMTDVGEGVRRSARDRRPSTFKQAVELYEQGSRSAGFAAAGSITFKRLYLAGAPRHGRVVPEKGGHYHYT